MSSDELLPVISKIIGDRLMVDPGSITRETTADDIDGWDSVTHTLLVMEVESQLGVTLDLDRIFDLKNVGDLVDLAHQSRERM